MSLRDMFGGMLIGAAVLCVAGIGITMAEDPVDDTEIAEEEPEPVRGSGDLPPVFTIRPAMRFPAVLPPPQAATERPMPPAPIEAEHRAALMQQTFDLAAGETGTLTAREPYNPDLGYLTFDLPHRFDPVHGVGFHPDPAGTAELNLLTQPGHVYLLDFSVNSWGEGTYRIEADGSSEEIADDGSRTHVLAGVRASARGWTVIRLSRTGTGFYLHAVDVTTAQTVSEAE